MLPGPTQFNELCGFPSCSIAPLSIGIYHRGTGALRHQRKRFNHCQNMFIMGSNKHSCWSCSRPHQGLSSAFLNYFCESLQDVNINDDECKCCKLSGRYSDLMGLASWPLFSYLHSLQCGVCRDVTSWEFGSNLFVGCAKRCYVFCHGWLTVSLRKRSQCVIIERFQPYTSF
jgi:hypothetical protein